MLVTMTAAFCRQVAVHAHPVAMGAHRVPTHDAANTDDAPSPVLADDQRRVPELARLLQRTGLQVSASVLGLGCRRFPSPPGWWYPRAKKKNNSRLLPLDFPVITDELTSLRLPPKQSVLRHHNLVSLFPRRVLPDGGRSLRICTE